MLAVFSSVVVRSAMEMDGGLSSSLSVRIAVSLSIDAFTAL